MNLGNKKSRRSYEPAAGHKNIGNKKATQTKSERQEKSTLWRRIISEIDHTPRKWKSQEISSKTDISRA